MPLDQGMTTTKEYRQAAIVFLLMSLIFFWPLFSGKILSQSDTLYFFPPWNGVKPAELTAPSNTVLNDQTREFLTFFQVAKESLRQMEFPLWNPYIMGGTPLLANSQSAVLFPLNWPFYVLPLFLGFTVSALLKLFIAGMGTYALSRRLSLSHLSAILSGTIYTFATFNIFWLNHPHTNGTIFFPILLLLAERVREDPSRSSMAFLGLTVGLQLLGGHVEIDFLIALAVTVFFLFRLIEYRKDSKAFFLRIKIFVGGYTLGFFLAGVLMIPFLEFLSQSATWQVRSEKNLFFIPPMGILSLFFSDIFVKVKWPFDLSPYHALNLYVGIAPLVLGIVTLILRPQKSSVFFVGLSLFAFAIIFGVPPFFSLLTSLPVFRQTPNWYMVVFYVLGMSLLAGMGMDKASSGDREPSLDKRTVLFFICASLTVVFFMVGLLWLIAKTSFVSPILNGVQGLSASEVGSLLRQVGKIFARSLFFLGVILALVAGAFWMGRFKVIWKMLAIGVIFADLFAAGSGWNPMIPIQWARVPLPPVLRFLNQDQTTYRIAGICPVMPPNVATLGGLQDVRGYDVPVQLRYHVFFQEALKGQTLAWIYDICKLEMESMPFLSLLNVKYLLSLDPLPPPLDLVYDKEIKVYKNPEVFPRAFLVHQVETVQTGPEALERVIGLGPKLKQIAVLEGSLPQSLLSLALQGNEETMKDRVQIVGYTARQIKIEVETSSPGLLVLGDTYFPGWKAEIDGKRVSVLRANYLLKGIAVDPGSHHVTFSYRPLSFSIGGGLTLISGGVIFWCLRRRKR